MRERHTEPVPKTPLSSANAADKTAEARARRKIKTLWQASDLFHVASRYPRKSNAPRVDRLAGILRSGLVAPGQCEDGSVHSDLNLVVTGCGVPYDSVIFLHRFGPQSSIYTICQPGRFAVFVDPDLLVLTPEEMEHSWVVLCQDEVYVRDAVALENLIGVAIHPADADSVLPDLLDDFRRVPIPLYDYDGNVLWPPG